MNKKATVVKISKEELKGLGCITLFFLPFVVVGCFLAFTSFWNIYKSQVSKSWAMTTAQVNDLRFESSTDDGAYSSEIVVSYTYSFNNVTYVGNRIGFGYGMNNIDSHNELFEKLRTAKKIIVFVNPKNLSESVITVGLNNSIVGLLIGAIMWNSFLLIFLIPIFSKKGNRPENLIFNITNPSND